MCEELILFIVCLVVACAQGKVERERGEHKERGEYKRESTKERERERDREREIEREKREAESEE
jgi:hypothetical protein